MSQLSTVLFQVGGCLMFLGGFYLWSRWQEREYAKSSSLVSKADVELGVKLLREQIHLDGLFLAEPIHQRKHMHLCIERERRIRGFSAILAELGENP